jgi:hypothetical protein
MRQPGNGVKGSGENECADAIECPGTAMGAESGRGLRQADGRRAGTAHIIFLEFLMSPMGIGGGTGGKWGVREGRRGAGALEAARREGAPSGQVRGPGKAEALFR